MTPAFERNQRIMSARKKITVVGAGNVGATAAHWLASKELGLDENTIVMYSSDNGAEKFTWPDGGTSPFRGEKNTNWEGTTSVWPGGNW